MSGQWLLVAREMRTACCPAADRWESLDWRCWSLKAHAARIGEIRVAQLNAESREVASTIEMKCFDQRALDLEDIYKASLEPPWDRPLAMPKMALDSATCTDPLFAAGPGPDHISCFHTNLCINLVSFVLFSTGHVQSVVLVARRRCQNDAPAGARYVFGSSNYLVLSVACRGRLLLADLRHARTPQNAHQRPTSGGTCAI